MEPDERKSFQKLNERQKAELFRMRFHGRDDVYARKWYDKEGNGNYSPVCQNVWKDKCHIKLKDGIGCSKCEIREFAPVTDESVWKHISGSEEHSIYVIKENGMIDFGAIDFDCKPNRDPKTSYFFEDVKKTADVCDELGIKYVLARSTSGGFHLYIFFDKEYPAAKFLAVIQSLVFERTGFAENRRLNVRLPPEVFPKQTSPGGQGGLGNPIKPPMIEARWGAERNCLIDKDNVMIPADQQWEYLAKAPINTAEIFDGLLEYYGIEVREEVQRVVSVSGKVIRVGGGVYNKDTGEWTPPTEGSMEKLIEGCAAFRRLREKMDTGYQPGHDEGFALFHCGALHTQDGMKYFQDGKVPGWGATDKDWRQLTQSVEKNYSPWTCRKMQEKGICIPGTKCFNKLPPTEMIEGQKVTNPDNLPEDQWPEPSPMRYSKGIGDEFLAKLTREVDALDSETDTEKQVVKIREIVARAQVFDKDQQTILKKHIEKKGFMKPRELGKVFNQAEKEKTEELTKTAASRSDTHLINGKLYRKLKPYGYAVSSKVKGNSEGFSSLSNFDMVITEVKFVVEDDEIRPKAKYYRGVFLYDGCEKTFEIEATEFYDNTELYKMAGTSLDMRAGIQRSDIEDFRSAVQAFSSNCKQVKCRASPGWVDDAYCMPSVIIDKNGIHPNSTVPIEIPEASLRAYDFKIVQLAVLLCLLDHIKKDLFAAFQPGPTLTLMGHVVLAFAARRLGIFKKPTLWFEGVTGQGKSDLVHSGLNFYGDFQRLLGWTSTGLGLRAMSNRAKDALLVVDDFKDMQGQSKAAIEFVQYSYDGAGRAALTKEADLRSDTEPRATNVVSGEQVPTGHASVLGRMIIVPSEDVDVKATRVHHAEVMKKRGEYCAVTPHLIHFFLGLDAEALKQEIEDTTGHFENGVERVVNGVRICKHLAQSYVCSSVFIRFLVHYGVMDESESTEWLTRHFDYLKGIRDQMAVDVSEENDADIFISTLHELLESRSVDLLMPGGRLLFGTGTVIGKIKSGRGVVELFSTITKAQVIQKLGPTYDRLRGNSIAKRLRKIGFIQKESSPKMKREGKMASTKSWKVPLENLPPGLSSQISGIASVPVREVTAPPTMVDGLI